MVKRFDGPYALAVLAFCVCCGNMADAQQFDPDTLFEAPVVIEMPEVDISEDGPVELTFPEEVTDVSAPEMPAQELEVSVEEQPQEEAPAVDSVLENTLSAAPQDEEVQPDATADLVISPPEIGGAPLFIDSAVDPSSIPSVLFTYWEHSAIVDARNSIGLVGTPKKSDKDANGEGKLKPENRDVSLGGIAYTNTAEWTIWLNGIRVTPKTVPGEILDLRVYKEYIEVKWFDDWSNKIYPIRLRPHQRFNLDTYMFLPG